MTTPNPAEVIAEALAKHTPNLRGECDECGMNVHQPRMLAAHQASVIAALPDIAIVQIPSVAHRGENISDAWAYSQAAHYLRGGYQVGGSNMRAAVAQLLTNVVDALDRRQNAARAAGGES